MGIRASRKPENIDLNVFVCFSQWSRGVFSADLAPCRRSFGQSVRQLLFFTHTQVWMVKGRLNRLQNRLLHRNVHSKGLWRRQEIYTESSGPKEGCFHAFEASTRAVRWVRLWQDWNIERHIFPTPRIYPQQICGFQGLNATEMFKWVFECETGALMCVLLHLWSIMYGLND